MATNLRAYKYLLEQLNNELEKEEIRFLSIYDIKRLLLQKSKTDLTTGVEIFNVINASINTLKTETIILLNKISLKIKEEEKKIITEYKEVSTICY